MGFLWTFIHRNLAKQKKRSDWLSVARLKHLDVGFRGGIVVVHCRRLLICLQITESSMLLLMWNDMW